MFQAVWMKHFGNCGPIVHLAADETISNIFDNYQHYSTLERLVHLVEHRYVDGVIGISEEICTKARILGVDSVEHVPPFTTRQKYEELTDITPSLETRQILVVGSNAEKNNLRCLQDVADETDTDVTFEVVGPMTEELGSQNVNGHGFVDEQSFFQKFQESSLFVMPAISQMFCVGVLEAMHAGIPPIVTKNVGARTVVEQVDSRFITETNVKRISDTIDMYFEMSAEERSTLSEEFRDVADHFDPESGIERFSVAYDRLLQNV